MSGVKSAQKRVRVAEKKRLRNKLFRSRCKTFITTAHGRILAGEPEAAQKAVAVAISSLDKAAEKRILHPNNAARRKSRLMKKLNKALSSTQAEHETAES